jgi:hypothetical protein
VDGTCEKTAGRRVREVQVERSREGAGSQILQPKLVNAPNDYRQKYDSRTIDRRTERRWDYVIVEGEGRISVEVEGSLLRLAHALQPLGVSSPYICITISCCAQGAIILTTMICVSATSYLSKHGIIMRI